MTREWQTAVIDPTDRRVFEALEDPRWDFRTVEGLSKTTGLPETTVRHVLARHPRFIRQSPIPDSEGRELFTLISNGVGLREWYRTTRAFITKSATS